MLNKEEVSSFEIHHCNEVCPERLLYVEAGIFYAETYKRSPDNIFDTREYFRFFMKKLLLKFGVLKRKNKAERERSLEGAMRMFYPSIDRFMLPEYGMKDPSNAFAGAVFMAYLAVKEVSGCKCDPVNQHLFSCHIVEFMNNNSFWTEDESGPLSISIGMSEAAKQQVEAFAGGNLSFKEILGKGK